jgi:ferric-dicitrate binding protein FerR (iron transport regulator)
MRNGPLIATIAAAALLAVLAIAIYPLVTEAKVDRVLLSDGTEALLLRGSKLLPATGFPRTRSAWIQGEMLLRVPASTAPFVLQTVQLVLTIRGPATLVISVNDTGAQYEVLDGHVSSRRAYPSRYDDVQEVEPGQVVVMNREIDLIEQEPMRAGDLAAWTRKYLGAGAARYK